MGLGRGRPAAISISRVSFAGSIAPFDGKTALGVATVLASLVEITLVFGGMIAFFEPHPELSDPGPPGHGE